jgi:hypothetical protein
MRTKDRTDKVIALTAAWWDRLGLVAHKIEFLQPLRFNQKLLDAVNGTAGGHTYLMLLHAMMLGVIQDLSALITDEFDTAVSLRNIVKILDDPEVLEQLRRRAALPVDYSDSIGADVPLDAAMRKISDWAAASQAEDKREFDAQIAYALPLAHAVLADPIVAHFKTARDKALAHIQLVMKDGKRAPYNISDLGLKWSDPEELLAKLEKFGHDLHIAITGLSITPARRREYNRDSVEDFYRCLCPTLMNA